MSQVTVPTPGLIFGSFLYRKTDVSRPELEHKWKERFGKSVLFDTPFCPMKKYYSKEMGEVEKLSRFFMVAMNSVKREELVSGKLWAIDIESNFLVSGARSVNLDIGILSLENIQLATGKNFTHRVHILNGIYSDLTLIFQKNTFRKLDWSYPDYSSPEVIEFFNWCRSILHNQLKSSLSCN